MKNPTFNNKTWWGDKVYLGYNKQSNKVLLVIVIVMKRT